MPELPEVEVAARNLRRWTARRRVRVARADGHARRIFRPATPAALRALAGARFEEVRRIGKNLLITLAGRSGPIGVWSHLGMTGKWLRRAAKDAAPPASRVEIELDDGTRLHYVDRRMFGRFRIVPGARFEGLPEIAALGPDPLTDGIDTRALHARLARSKLPIKVAIMDQALLPGVGNIQASEALFRAAIDPRRPARALSLAEVKRLGRAILESIRFTLETFAGAGADNGAGADGRGAAAADADIGYVEERTAPNPFLVYARAGARCPRCKKGTILRIVQAQRATFFCSRCQK
jgi:formamidopyrimidine-DNA glycosylase